MMEPEREAPLRSKTPCPESSWCLTQRSRKRALPGQAISQKMSLTSAPPDVMDRPPSSNRNAESHRSTTPAPTASWSARACVTRKPLAATELTPKVHSAWSALCTCLRRHKSFSATSCIRDRELPSLIDAKDSAVRPVTIVSASPQGLT